MAKIICVLYDDPVTGYPKSYPRDSIPTLKAYPNGQTLPTPEHIDFTPGALLGCVSGRNCDFTTILASLPNSGTACKSKKIKNEHCCRYWFGSCGPSINSNT